MISIYICHHEPNKDRLFYLERVLSQCPFNIHFVTVGLPGDECRTFEKIKEEIDRCDNNYMNICHETADIFAANQAAVVCNQGLLDINAYVNGLKYLKDLGWCKEVKGTGLPSWLKQRNLTNPEISLNIKHRFCLASLLISPHEDIAVIAEDDIVFRLDSYELLATNVDKAMRLSCHYSHPVYIDVGGGCGLQAPKHRANSHGSISPKHNSKSELTQPILPTSRTTCAYIINKKFAEYFFRILPSPCAPIDFELTYCMNQMMNVSCFWAEPCVFEHGSQNGHYKSSIQNSIFTA